MSFLSYVFAIMASCVNPVQAGANAQLNKGLSSPLWSALIVYASGLAGVFLIQATLRQAWPGARFGAVPWWAYVGGLLSIASTLAGLTLAHKMGSGVFTGLSVTASVVTSIALDHFGLLGFTPHPLSSWRTAGACLMVAGIWLIAKF